MNKYVSNSLIETMKFESNYLRHYYLELKLNLIVRSEELFYLAKYQLRIIMSQMA